MSDNVVGRHDHLRVRVEIIPACASPDVVGALVGEDAGVVDQKVARIAAGDLRDFGRKQELRSSAQRAESEIARHDFARLDRSIPWVDENVLIDGRKENLPYRGRRTSGDGWPQRGRYPRRLRRERAIR